MKVLQKTWVVGPFQCNCRLIVCPKTGEGILVDPGDEPQKIIRELESTSSPAGVGQPIRIKALLHTHGHLDHIAATRKVSETLAAGGSQKPMIALHRGDHELYLNLRMQGQLFGMQYEDPLPVDHFLEDGEELRIGELKLTVIHTPGHSPGSACLRLHEDKHHGMSEMLLSGDTLFKGSVGRTDLWGANQDQMFASIKKRILTLDDDTRVCPGHGPDSSVGIEKRSNPFLT